MKKIILSIISVIVLCIVLLIGTMVWVCKANDTNNKDNPICYGDTSNDKKALIIYQNGRSSYNKDVAESIANGLVDKGYYVTSNQPGDYLEKDLSKYDLVLFGSPVYASNISSVLKEYVNSIDNYGKAKVICYSVGNAPDNDELKKFNDLSNIKIDGSFKVSKRKFDSNKNIAMDEINKIIQ